MDKLSLIGVVFAVGAVLLGQTLEGGHVSSLLNGPAMLIVLGGALGAIMLQAPPAQFSRALHIFRWTFNPPRLDTRETVRKIISWSNVARKEGLLGLEDFIDAERDAFIRRGLQLLVDGREPGGIRAALEMEIDHVEHQDLGAAKLYEAMGGYTPTIGIIGAVMGLIHVMENLSEPSKLGAGIATAFVATIYGVGLANLFLIPVGAKLKAQVLRVSRHREMIMEGLISIAEGENPANIQAKLEALEL